MGNQPLETGLDLLGLRDVIWCASRISVGGNAIFCIFYTVLLAVLLCGHLVLIFFYFVVR